MLASSGFQCTGSHWQCPFSILAWKVSDLPASQARVSQGCLRAPRPLGRSWGSTSSGETTGLCVHSRDPRALHPQGRPRGSASRPAGRREPSSARVPLRHWAGAQSWFLGVVRLARCSTSSPRAQARACVWRRCAGRNPYSRLSRLCSDFPQGSFKSVQHRASPT